MFLISFVIDLFEKFGGPEKGRLFVFFYRCLFWQRRCNSDIPLPTPLNIPLPTPLPTPLNCWGGSCSGGSCSGFSLSAKSEKRHTGHGSQSSPFSNCRVHSLHAGRCLHCLHTYRRRRSASKHTGHLFKSRLLSRIPHFED